MVSENQEEHVRSLVEEIATATHKSRGDILKNEAVRVQIIRASRQLTAMLENPVDAASELAFLVCLPFLALHTTYSDVGVDNG